MKYIDRLVGEIFRILVEEKLSYKVVKVKQDVEQQDLQEMNNLTYCAQNRWIISL